MAIHSTTRTTHTITIPLPDDVIGKIQTGDEVEVVFTSSVCGGRTPRPQKLSWSWLNFIMGWL